MKNSQIIERYISLSERERVIIRTALLDGDEMKCFQLLRTYFPDIGFSDMEALNGFAA